MEIIFDNHVNPNSKIKGLVEELASNVNIMECSLGMSLVVFQDGVSGAYYVKCSIQANDAAPLCDLEAKLDYKSAESFKANRDLSTRNKTYQKMELDAGNGREFNDIIVEYNTEYKSLKPLKVWGGQHRINAITQKGSKSNRFHGFRIYFDLTPQQRTEVALISNTSMSVANDTFDRMIEETKFGDRLRLWCVKVGLLKETDNFPDALSRSDNISVKLARSFVVNFYQGKENGGSLSPEQLDSNVYEPYSASTGSTGETVVDKEYEQIMNSINILDDDALITAGEKFSALHHAQVKAIEKSQDKTLRKKSFKNKALVESVLCGWSYAAGLLQTHPERLNNLFSIPKTTKRIPDPLNAKEMSEYKHEYDPKTYRGLGTRSSPKDKQRIVQLFLTKSQDPDSVVDYKLMDEAVNQHIHNVTGAKLKRR